MKILNVVKTNIGATWAFNQFKYINMKDDIEIVTIIPKEKGNIKKKYEDNNMKVIESDFSLPIRRPWKIFSRVKEIRRIIKEESPDIIHTHFVTNILMLRIALRKSKIKRIFQVPGPLHLENKFFRWLDIITATKYDYWIASCQKTYNIYIKEKVPKENIFLSYYGIENIGEYEEPKNKLRKELNMSDDDILVGMVSYFYKPKKYLGQKRGIKGHEDFIDAISILVKDNPKIKGIIIGSAWGKSQKYEQKVIKYAKKVCPNNIIFTGFRTDLKDIYRELDVVVHPSHSENLGGAAESLAAGVPTVATKIGGFPDIVIDGETGYLCNVSEPKSIAEKVQKILSNKTDAARLTTNGKKKVKELLDLNKTSSTIINIYEKLCEENKNEDVILL